MFAIYCCLARCARNIRKLFNRIKSIQEKALLKYVFRLFTNFLPQQPFFISPSPLIIIPLITSSIIIVTSISATTPDNVILINPYFTASQRLKSIASFDPSFTHRLIVIPLFLQQLVQIVLLAVLPPVTGRHHHHILLIVFPTAGAGRTALSPAPVLPVLLLLFAA